MNKYYIYIDESGSFKETKDRSFVGGFITQETPEKLYKKIEIVLKNFQSQHGKILGIEDIHAAEILHPYNFSDTKNQTKYTEIDLRIRTEFIAGFSELVKQETIYFIKSENKQFQFGEENAQSRYGNCLGAWFQKAIDILVEREQDKKFQLKFAIAYRNQKCLPEGTDFKSYHQKMNEYVKNLCNENSNILNKDEFITHISDLLRLADIACHIINNIEDKDFLKNKIYKTKPNEFITKNYQNFHQKSQKDLIEKGEIAAAYRLAESEKERREIFAEISKLKEKQQPTQIRYFLNVAYELVEKRTFTKDALTQAKNIFEKIFNTFQDSENEKIQAVIKDAINGLILCANHSGEIVKQIDLLEHAQKIIQKQQKLPALVRHAQILEIRNRTLNDQFNDYLFDEIIESFESEIENYAKLIKIAKEQKILPENEKDHLLHKLFGTLGQAYAFLSAQDIDYFEESINYFQKSLQYFNESLDDPRTPIYLATLYWYHKKFEEAEQILKDYDIISLDQILVENLMILVEKEPDQNTAFILSILLHLIVEQNLIDLDTLQKIEKQIKFQNKHPFELIYKWLGIAYLNIEKKDQKAIQYFEKAINIQQGITIQTINLSAHALKIIASQKLNRDTTKALENFEKSLNEVIKDSQGFKIYIQERGGKEKLMKDMEEQNIESIIRWLPFSYA